MKTSRCLLRFSNESNWSLLMRISFLAFLFICPCLLSAQYKIDLSIQVPINKGTVLLAVYGSETDFDENENAILSKKIPVDRVGEYTVSLEGLAAGSYTIALFQDINNNGKLDTNFMGIPKEPYAFSRNPKVKWLSLIHIWRCRRRG